MKKTLSLILSIILFMGVLSNMCFAASGDTAVSGNFGENSYTIMGNNILMVSLCEKETPTTRFEQIMASFRHYDPDIFGLQECDELWHDVLDGDKGFATLGYAPAVTGFGELRNPIYYKTEKFKVPTVVYVDRKPKEIKCDGKYKVIELPGNIGYDIEFKTGIGENEIEIEF